MIGTILDKYEILQKVGEGGMATVYRGRHLTLGRDVAIKVLHPHLSASERNRQRFAREARAIEHLDHDNILKIFDYSGTLGEDCYIVTEFVEGATLQHVVTDRGRVPSEVASIIGLKLATALSYAHELGIIHRDLKPENVMLRRDGAVKLMDFGIARFMDEMNLTVTGALVGSPAYMSPEQAMERVLDPRSDLFSLGTLLYHLITGQLPFSGSNPSIILRNIIEGNRPELVELAPEVSPELAQVVESLLQTDPGDRPNTAADIQDSLVASLESVHIDLDNPSWSLQSWLADPGGYEGRLQAHLEVVLLEEGRRRLDARDHLGSLRLLNRLLSIDEDNEEVLALIQSMHSGGQERPTSRRWWSWATAGALALTGLLTWVLWPEAEVAPPEPDRQEVAVVEPAPDVVDEVDEAQEVASSASTPAPAPSVDIGVPEALAALPPVLKRVDTPGTRVDQSTGARRMVRPEANLAVADAAIEEPEPPPPEPGLITVTTLNRTWADIYVDGELVGRTPVNTEIEVAPGTHELRLVNPFAQPHEQHFTVASGERLVIDVAILPKPATFVLPPHLDGACQATLDDLPQGPLRSLGYKLAVSEPRQAHTLKLACPGQDETVTVIPPTQPGRTVTVEL